MFRKLIIALGATAALVAAASSPALAYHSHHHGHGHGWGWGALGAGVALGLAAPVVASYPYASNCYVQKRWIATPYGPRLRRVPVCY
jgi:hypothetical protein